MKSLYLPIIIIVTFVTIYGLATSCYYDSEEALYPDLGMSCDTSNITFSGTVKGILNSNCLSCHSNQRASSDGNNIRLQDYADVSSQATRVSGAINHLPQFMAMPKNGRKLNSCLIKQFDIWVRMGSPNN